MDNIGFRNWGNSSGGYSSNESSPPTYTSDDPYSFPASRRAQNNSSIDDYDFKIEDNYDDKKGDTKRSSLAMPTATSERGTADRRKSTDERMKEIRDRHHKLTEQSKKNADVNDEDNHTSSWNSNWASIVEGVHDDTGFTKKETATTITAGKKERSAREKSYASQLKPSGKVLSPSTASATATMRQAYGRSFDSDASPNSSGLDISDSLDLSAGDFEVGAYAAKRNMEKTTERRRRLSISEDPTKAPKAGIKSNSMSMGSHSEILEQFRPIEASFLSEDESGEPERAAGNETYNTTTSSAPVASGISLGGPSKPSLSTTPARVSTTRRVSSEGEVPGFKMSAALSSIDGGNRASIGRSSIGVDGSFGQEDGGGIVRYGSLERSDGELYNMLSLGARNSVAGSKNFSDSELNLSDVSELGRGAKPSNSKVNLDTPLDESADIYDTDDFDAASPTNNRDVSSPVSATATTTHTNAPLSRSDAIAMRWLNPNPAGAILASLSNSNFANISSSGPGGAEESVGAGLTGAYRRADEERQVSGGSSAGDNEYTGGQGYENNDDRASDEGASPPRLHLRPTQTTSPPAPQPPVRIELDSDIPTGSHSDSFADINRVYERESIDSAPVSFDDVRTRGGKTQEMRAEGDLSDSKLEYTVDSSDNSNSDNNNNNNSLYIGANDDDLGQSAGQSADAVVNIVLKPAQREGRGSEAGTAESDMDAEVEVEMGAQGREIVFEGRRNGTRGKARAGLGVTFEDEDEAVPAGWASALGRSPGLVSVATSVPPPQGSLSAGALHQVPSSPYTHSELSSDMYYSTSVASDRNGTTVRGAVPATTDDSFFSDIDPSEVPNLLQRDRNNLDINNSDPTIAAARGLKQDSILPVNTTMNPSTGAAGIIPGVSLVTLTVPGEIRRADDLRQHSHHHPVLQQESNLFVTAGLHAHTHSKDEHTMGYVNATAKAVGLGGSRPEAQSHDIGFEDEEGRNLLYYEHTSHNHTPHYLQDTVVLHAHLTEKEKAAIHFHTNSRTQRQQPVEPPRVLDKAKRVLDGLNRVTAVEIDPAYFGYDSNINYVGSSNEGLKGKSQNSSPVRGRSKGSESDMDRNRAMVRRASSAGSGDGSWRTRPNVSASQEGHTNNRGILTRHSSSVATSNSATRAIDIPMEPSSLDTLKAHLVTLHRKGKWGPIGVDNNSTGSMNAPGSSKMPTFTHQLQRNSTPHTTH